jgi:hypothetical protein
VRDGARPEARRQKPVNLGESRGRRSIEVGFRGTELILPGCLGTELSLTGSLPGTELVTTCEGRSKTRGQKTEASEPGGIPGTEVG